MQNHRSIRAQHLSWMTLLAMLVLVVGGCQDENVYVSPPPPKVTVGRPIQRNVTDYAEFTGTTECVESHEVRARVAGYLENIHFEDGARVSEGDLLFTIEQDPYEARLARARATLELSRAELRLAKVTLKRKESAHSDNAISEIELIEARARRDIAAASVAAAQAVVDAAELDLSYTEIHAAISGKISRRLVDEGNLVGAGQNTLLATIVRDEHIYTYFNVSERELLRFLRNMGPAETPEDGRGETAVFLSLDEPAGELPVGRLDYVDNRVDPSTGTILTRAVFPNEHGTLVPGLFVRVRIALGDPRPALLVPERALGADQRGPYLAIVKADNTVEYRPVEIGPQVENLRVIEKGLHPDDRVVVMGVQRARPGATVVPVENEAKPEHASDAAKGGGD